MIDQAVQAIQYCCLNFRRVPFVHTHHTSVLYNCTLYSLHQPFLSSDSYAVNALHLVAFSHSSDQHHRTKAKNYQVNMADNKGAAGKEKKNGNDAENPQFMGDEKGEAKKDNKDGNDEDDPKCPFTGEDVKRFDAAYTCLNEDCKKQNNGKRYEYTSNTYIPEFQRECPKCGTVNEKHSGEYIVLS